MLRAIFGVKHVKKKKNFEHFSGEVKKLEFFIYL